MNKSSGLCATAASDEPRPCGRRSFALASLATFCLEPTSDELLRSHTYLAMHAGCIPVIFDGHPTTSSREWADGASRDPTRWAWRQPKLLQPLLHAGDAAAVSLHARMDYSAFACVYSAHDLHRGKLDRVVVELLALASEPAHAAKLLAMRRALERAAPLTRYAPPGERCGGKGAAEPNVDPCDAFSSLVLNVRARTARATSLLPNPFS